MVSVMLMAAVAAVTAPAAVAFNDAIILMYPHIQNYIHTFPKTYGKLRVPENTLTARTENYTNTNALSLCLERTRTKRKMVRIIITGGGGGECAIRAHTPANTFTRVGRMVWVHACAKISTRSCNDLCQIITQFHARTALVK